MTLEASRKRLEDIPGGFQDAPGRSGTLLEASGTLLDAVGRSWKPPLESRTAREVPNITHVLFLSLWEDDGGLKPQQQVARRTPL